MILCNLNKIRLVGKTNIKIYKNKVFCILENIYLHRIMFLRDHGSEDVPTLNGIIFLEVISPLFIRIYIYI